MPLTSKGREILSNMKKEYGEKKGEQVFYASANAGKITGVHDGADSILDAIAHVRDDHGKSVGNLSEYQDRLDTMWMRSGDAGPNEPNDPEPIVVAGQKEVQLRQIKQEIERMKKLHEAGNSLAKGRLEALQGQVEVLELEISTLRHPAADLVSFASKEQY